MTPVMNLVNVPGTFAVCRFPPPTAPLPAWILDVSAAEFLQKVSENVQFVEIRDDPLKALVSLRLCTTVGRIVLRYLTTI
jgi:hypothetical protein